MKRHSDNFYFLMIVGISIAGIIIMLLMIRLGR